MKKNIKSFAIFAAVLFASNVQCMEVVQPSESQEKQELNFASLFNKLRPMIEKMVSDDSDEQKPALKNLENAREKPCASMMDSETVKIAERAFDDPAHLKVFQAALNATPSECTEEEARKIIPLWQAEQIQLFYSFSPPEAEEKGAQVKEEECDRTLSAFALITSLTALVQSPIKKALSSDVYRQIFEQEMSKYEFQDALTYHIFRTHAGLSDFDARRKVGEHRLIGSLSSLVGSLEKILDSLGDSNS